jgi:BirA family biotin operon repressor/biotin-[acetyl-CoA-carboxylase] ligase
MTATLDSINQQILQRLATGENLSGGQLARELGISRNAVWKRISQLREVGLDIQAAAGRGYCLPQSLELIDEQKIQAALPPELDKFLTVRVQPSTASTNLVVSALALDKQHGRVVLAEHQSAGRGRHGRSWHSPFGSNIYLSMGWQFDEGVAAMGCLSLAAGVAVIRALRECGVTGAGLKWPNDLRMDGRKLAGTLIEVNGDVDGPCHAIVGVGINVAMPASTTLDQPWSDLSGQEEPPGRNHLAVQIITQLAIALQQFAENGFTPFRREWELADELQGRSVTVFQGHNRHHGVARGLSESGGLLVRLDDGVREFHSGEVSVRDA